MSNIHSSDQEDSSDWIQEEELLLKFAENTSFNLEPLMQIGLVLIYVDRTQDIVDVVETAIDLLFDAPGETTRGICDTESITSLSPPPLVAKSTIKWEKLKHLIDGHSSRNGLRYLFNDAAYYHESVNYDQLDIFNPSAKLINIERDKDVKLPSALPIFHDISQIFVIMREATSIGKTLKSILRSGSKIGKTKKVRISEASAEIMPSSRKTRKTN